MRKFDKICGYFLEVGLMFIAVFVSAGVVQLSGGEISFTDRIIWALGVCAAIQTVRLAWVETGLTFLSQEIVDKQLAALAREFTNLCNKQVQFQTAEAAVAQCAAIAHKIETAKKAFWSARYAARRLGFEVKEKVGDYVA